MELVDDSENPRIYPDFTWSMLFHFTQNHYRADSNTLQVFSASLQQQQQQNSNQNQNITPTKLQI